MKTGPVLAFLLIGTAQDKTPSSGFTGPEVPWVAPVFGDYVHIGARTAEKRTNIPALMKALEKMRAQDYLHLVWKESEYPKAWDDFLLLAPEFQKTKRRLWLYLTPPSEGVPDPFKDDYVRWAVECAQVAKKYPCVAGLCIDDFDENSKKFTPAYLKQMMDEAHKIAPKLALLVVCYYERHARSTTPYVKAGVVDGIIFPYFFPHKNHTNTQSLLPQIEAFRKHLDSISSKRVPLIPMIYGSKHSQAPQAVTPDYVKACLQICLEATRKGLADGAVMYCLPKDRPEFVAAAAQVFDAFGK